MPYQTLQVKKLTPHIGAEISGVDLSRPLGNQQFQEVHDALMENQVVFFRDQHLTHDQHKAFGRLFGELAVHPASPNAPEGHPEILTIHADEKSKHVAGEEWHSDVSCDPEPPMGSILYLTEVPPEGGDTLFASMYAAYEKLSPPIRQLFEGLTAIHDGEPVYRGRFGWTDARGQAFPRGRAPGCPHPPGDRPERIVRQPELHHRDKGPEQTRKRRPPADAVPPLRDPGIPMPLPLAAEFGRVLGQSLRPAPRDVGLLPPAPPRLPRHGEGRPPVLPGLADLLSHPLRDRWSGFRSVDPKLPQSRRKHSISWGSGRVVPAFAGAGSEIAFRTAGGCAMMSCHLGQEPACRAEATYALPDFHRIARRAARRAQMLRQQARQIHGGARRASRHRLSSCRLGGHDRRRGSAAETDKRRPGTVRLRRLRPERPLGFAIGQRLYVRNRGENGRSPSNCTKRERSAT